jgi:hypothetical protein
MRKSMHEEEYSTDLGVGLGFPHCTSLITIILCNFKRGVHNVFDDMARLRNVVG